MRKYKSNYIKTEVAIIFFCLIFSFMFKSIIVDKIALIFISYSLIKIGSKEKSLINPYYLFFLTPFSLLIYFNISDVYMSDLTHDTYFLAIINIAAFIFTLMLTSNVKTISNNRFILSLKERFSQRLIIISFYVISLLGYVYDPLSSVLWLFSIPAMIASFKLLEKRMILLTIIFIIFSATIEISKTQVLLYLLTVLISVEKFFFRKKFNNGRLIFYAFLSLWIILYSFTFANKERGIYDSNSGLEYYSKEGGITWNYSSDFFLPYMYLTTPWTNLQYVVKTQNIRTNGLWMVKPFLGYLNLDNTLNLKNEYKLESFSNFNTFTFIAVGFKDFGYWFSILPTILIGFLVKKVYSRFILSNSSVDLACWVIFSLATIEMFFSNHFFMLSYPFTMLIIVKFLKILRKIKYD